MLKDYSVINVLNITEMNDKLHIIGTKYKTAQDLITIPGFRSRFLGIQIVSQPGEIEFWPCESIYCKLFKVESTKGTIVYPIIHTVAGTQ